ncbi:MAG: Na(+)/H(+) antiporter subunit D [Candidatus Diapherotrites archaeon]|nr:Na(+)/H(+) antiporter subunit D [Candidatus Diapherotrites archaeon]
MTFIFHPAFIFFLGLPLLLLKGNLRRAAVVLLAALAVLVTFSLQPGSYYSLDFMNFNLVMLNVDSLSLFTGYIFVIITFCAILYASHFDKTWIYFFAILYAGTSLGAVFAGDFITLIIFWELMAISSTALVWIHGGEAASAAFRYLLFHLLGGSLLLGSIAIQYFSTGSLLIGASVMNPWALLLMTLAVGINLGIIPLHTWLPDTYPKPHIASSVFLSVYTTKTAVYFLARMAPSFAVLGAMPLVGGIIAILGGIMAIYGVSFALIQNNMRKLLSYHILSQVGYMVAGIGLGTAIGLNGGMFHLFNNLLYKTLLFMCVGAVIYRTGFEKISQLGGLWKKMPITAITFFIAALAIAGIPGLNGYLSKGMVITASEDFTVLWLLLEIASIGTFLSFLKLGYFVFLRKGKDLKVEEAPKTMLFAQAAIAIACVVIGLYPALVLGILPVQEALEPLSLAYLLETTAILGATAILFFTIGKKILAPHDTGVKDFDVLYNKFGNWVLSASAATKELFIGIFAAFSGWSRFLFSFGSLSGKMEDRDLNWNLMLSAIMLLFIFALMWMVAAW